MSPPKPILFACGSSLLASAVSQPRLDPLLRPLNLSADDFPALEAFLDSLNADSYDQSAPATVLSGLPVPR